MRLATLVVLAALVAACQSAAAGPTPSLTASSPSSSPVATASPTAAAPKRSLPSGRIAFQRSGDVGGIFSIDATGTDEKRILAGSFGTPKWSPDGSRLAVYAEKPDDRVVPAIVQPDGSAYHELTLPAGLNCGLSAWSPGGTKLALECWDEHEPARTGIYLALVNGADFHQITRGHGLPADFSTDGRELLFARDPDGSSLELAMVDVDGSHERTIGDDAIGQMPGFLAGDHTVYAVIGGAIAILDLSGKRLQTIEAPEPKVKEARVSPDGAFFAFVYDPMAAVAPGLYRMAFDGSAFGRIVHTDVEGIQEEHPDWVP
jgi:Tol biopolymer transport system component